MPLGAFALWTTGTILGCLWEDGTTLGVLAQQGLVPGVTADTKQPQQGWRQIQACLKTTYWLI